ncbi:cytoplasmic dynein heavy chain 1 [Malassezia pachydermatis]|uniref:Dynein heavy chain, cytoplasmic n=1 Tax=Malassezia pachydermatis TaxID=77020 RepID=A0A0M8MTF7_9BASI|nr:cytoplasmic dynein heavy chain 1 [Malassezia pachydermatis]KOS13271.1 cytoplasmic dynein heavy chain 1 [Malassezia pachydermatis]
MDDGDGHVPIVDIDVGELRKYLEALLPIVLGTDSASVASIWSQTRTEDYAKTFLQDNTVPVLFVDQVAEEEGAVHYTIAQKPTWSGNQSSVVALMKRQATLDAHVPLASQIRVVTLLGAWSSDVSNPDAVHLLETPYEALEHVLHNVMAPWVDAYVEGHPEDREEESKTGAPLVRRKLSELEWSLRHVQQHMEIPQVVLNVHPIIEATCERVGDDVSANDLEPASLLEDDAFINRLHADMNGWVRAVQTVTKLDRDASSGTALQEANFWAAMENALDSMDRQLHAPAITLTLDVLTRAKRFHATVSFHADTGLKDCMEKVHGYNTLLKDLPLNDVVSATTLEGLAEAQRTVLVTFTKKLRVSTYPIRRSLDFVEALGRDVRDALLKVLGSMKLMQLVYTTFAATMAIVDEMLDEWEENVKEFVYVARNITRKRGDKFIPIKITSPFMALRARLAYIGRLRRAHEELVEMVHVGRYGKAQGVEGSVQDIEHALDGLRHIDVLDTSDKGTAALSEAETHYNERVSHVETRLIEQLRQLLRDARSARERLRILAHFNRLFVRPRVRAAVQEYQTVLLQSVRTDLDALRRKFQQGYRHSDAHLVGQLRHQAEIVGAIVWVSEMERQLQLYRQRVQDALGDGWTDHVEGQRLYAESEAFLQQLDPRKLVYAWAQDMGHRASLPQGYVLQVVSTRDGDEEHKASSDKLLVQYDAHTFALADEAHALMMLGQVIPQALVSLSRDARRLFPYVLALDSALHTLHKVTSSLASVPMMASLLAQAQLDTRTHLETLMLCRWEHLLEGANGYENEYVTAVDALGKAVLQLESLADQATSVQAKLDALLTQLKTCEYTKDAFQSTLASMQSQIYALTLQGFVNLPAFVNAWQARVDDVLVSRMEEALTALCANLDDPSQWREDLPIVHIVVRSNTLQLDPPVEQAQMYWFQALGSCLDTVLQQVQLNVTSEVWTRQEQRARTLQGLMVRLPPAALQAPLQRVQRAMEEARAYADRWLALQVLWDVEPDTVAPDASMETWLSLLSEIRTTRSFIEAPARRSKGLIHLDATLAQSRVLTRFEAWYAALGTRFAAYLHTCLRDMHTTMTTWRTTLEPLSAMHTSTTQVVQLITSVAQLTHELRTWTPYVDLLAQGQSLLLQQRWPRPQDWVYAEQVKADLSTLRELHAQKHASIEAQQESLHVRMAQETRALSAQAQSLQEAWAHERPSQGAVPVAEALRVLGEYEARVSALQKQAGMLADAREVFGLEAHDESILSVVADEVTRLKQVWSALAELWGELDELRQTPWSRVQVRQVRQRLESILRSCRALPSRVRAYEAYETLHDHVQFLLTHIKVLGDLQSEAFQSRHWRSLHTNLGAPRYVASTHTLGDVWALDWHLHLTTIQAAIAEAQGEYALDVYLQQVRDAWTAYTLELVDYRHECMLLRGFDTIFQLAQEHAGGLQAMAASAYYRTFEEEAHMWEERVARIHTTFDLWTDVQRQWVYLRGVFSAGADMAHMLPVESGRFQSVSSEFLALLKKVVKSPRVLDVIQIPGIRGSLERLTELLHRIQTALGEYLERERARFPRFYFVGDEDLLDMLGHGRDVVHASKHLTKMFAGVASVVVEQGQIQAIRTTADEVVDLHTPIPVRQDVPVHVWLQALEQGMPQTLKALLPSVLERVEALDMNDKDALAAFLAMAPTQLVLLAWQIAFVRRVEACPSQPGHWTAKDLQPLHAWITAPCAHLSSLAGDVATLRRPAEQCLALLLFLTTVLHQITDASPFVWQQQLRHYWDGTEVHVRMAYASFTYGFEVLGAQERLIPTPLTNASYITLTQALKARQGGAPFGPAGTGKTETVKALGAELGRWVLVFNCDQQFDESAMARLLLGLARVGAWGCFDEFNRLDERVLSSVSQSMQAVQQALAHETEARIGSVLTRVQPSTGLFVTMNPSYAGRSHLPDNLVKLFRRVAMTQPDSTLIVEGWLRMHGFTDASSLACKMVTLFQLCMEQLSDAPHYDFGLRALKAVLVGAAHARRSNPAESEINVIVQSVQETVPPRLVAEDAPLFAELVADVFPGIAPSSSMSKDLVQALEAECEAQHLGTGAWLEKIWQLHHVLDIAPGVVLVGEAGTGKTRAWRTLLQALERVEQRAGVAHVLDPKVLSKEALYGTWDPTTREWTDGLFTYTLRRILDRASTQRHWIVFDGDLDPDWVETLNSVLDDNRQLTLPTGERLPLPSNVRLLFEVDSVAYATRATITRCGMVWFPSDAVTPAMRQSHTMACLQAASTDDDTLSTLSAAPGVIPETQRIVVEAIEAYWAPGSVWDVARASALRHAHCMVWSEARALAAWLTWMRRAIQRAVRYQVRHPDFPLNEADMRTYAQRSFLLATLWAMAGDATDEVRQEVCAAVAKLPSMPTVPGRTWFDVDVDIAPGAPWRAWSEAVPKIRVDARVLTTSDLIIPTVDTVRHESLLQMWLHEQRPVVLCGPPGAGKTMVLLEVLRRWPDVDVVTLNFSSQTTCDTLLRTLESHCVYEYTASGQRLVPRAPGRRLVLFCDEINLPTPDACGTQRVLALLRQWIEHGGFYRQLAWVTLERIQIVGACNPPTDAGRTPLPPRWLRHTPVVWVGYPSDEALVQIYSTLAQALLQSMPSLLGYVDAVARGMVTYFRATQAHFSTAQQAHYVYSPRELTRWIRGMHQLMTTDTDLDDLVRIWAHEALRVFQDRLVTPEDKAWSDEALDEAARTAFPGLDVRRVLRRPLLYSDWLSRTSKRVDREALRSYAHARLRGFAEEALETELVLHDAVLDLALRCDRVLQQPAGHLLLIGVAGSGRTTMARFCAWLRGLALYNLPTSRAYDEARFDDDLRALLRRVGIRGERVCWTLDESQMAVPARVEKLNTLLANAEVAGLFEGDEYTSLLSALRDAAQRQGLVLHADDELLSFFRAQITANLHVVLTMTPPRDDLTKRATASPALLNRCTLVYCW